MKYYIKFIDHCYKCPECHMDSDSPGYNGYCMHDESPDDSPVINDACCDKIPEWCPLKEVW